MTAGARRWTVRLTAAAEADFQEILRWTLAQFGEAQARVCAETLSAALKDLAAGPSVAGARERDDIAKPVARWVGQRAGRVPRERPLTGNFRGDVDRLKLAGYGPSI